MGKMTGTLIKLGLGLAAGYFAHDRIQSAVNAAKGTGTSTSLTVTSNTPAAQILSGKTTQ